MDGVQENLLDRYRVAVTNSDVVHRYLWRLVLVYLGEDIVSSHSYFYHLTLTLTLHIM